MTADPRTGTAKTDHGRAGRNLPAAIVVGAILIGIPVVTLTWWHWGFVIYLCAMLVMAALEFDKALRRIDLNSAIVPIIIGTIFLCFGSYFVAQRELNASIAGATFLLAALAVTILGSLIWRMWAGSAGFVRDAAASLFIIGYVPLLGSFAALMLAGDNGAWRIVAFVCVVTAGDTGGYVGGVLFGKHPMVPTISPKKTWEGLIGSYIFGIAVAIAFAVLALNSPWWVGLIFGFCLVSFGVCGDLMASIVKRDVGLKDMGSILPGHGGVMDRLDSLLLAGPVAWLVLYLLVPGG